jgi:hypothetical protein
VSASNSAIQTTRHPGISPINATTSTLTHSTSRISSTTALFNNLVNICATAILVAILVFLELHIRRSTLHSHPAVMRNANDAVHGMPLHIPAQSKAVER